MPLNQKHGGKEPSGGKIKKEGGQRMDLWGEEDKQKPRPGRKEEVNGETGAGSWGSRLSWVPEEDRRKNIGVKPRWVPSRPKRPEHASQ